MYFTVKMNFLKIQNSMGLLATDLQSKWYATIKFSGFYIFLNYFFLSDIFCLGCFKSAVTSAKFTQEIKMCSFPDFE